VKKISLNSSVLVDLSKGDNKAFELVFATYSSNVFKYLLYILKDVDEAEEVLQNVFLKLWNKREGVLTDRDILPYLLKIANSYAIDVLRRNVRKQNLINAMLFDSIQVERSVEDIFLHKEEVRKLEQAINNLPPKRKEIFKLCKMEGKSYSEVGEILNISPSTISNQLVSAMKYIKSYLSE